MMMMETLKHIANKIFTKFVNTIPFLLVGLCLLAGAISKTDLYSKIYMYLGDVHGFSIMTSLVFLKKYSHRSYCNPTKAAVYGLLVMNIVNLLVLSKVIVGSSWYDISIGFLVFVILLISLFKRW